MTLVGESLETAYSVVKGVSLYALPVSVRFLVVALVLNVQPTVFYLWFSLSIIVVAVFVYRGVSR